MPVPMVAPGYLSPRCLPYASDIFYHDRIIYLMPTGIHPMQFHAVAGFAEYCQTKGLALPRAIWEMLDAYFRAGQLAAEALDLIAPLRPRHILSVCTVYSRDVHAIRAAKEAVRKDPVLTKLLPFSPEFLARELMSHLFLELFMSSGYEGVIDYLRREAATPEMFAELVAATLVNRLRLFVGGESSLLLYEHEWYPFLMRIGRAAKATGAENPLGSSDSLAIEHLRYKLFEAVLNSVFGRVESPDIAEKVARTAERRSAEVEAMKRECLETATELFSLRTTDQSLKDRVLQERIETRMVEPLVGLAEKSKSDVMRLLQGFVLDSTVIGGGIAIAQGADASTIGIAAAAGALSAGLRYLMDEHSQHRVQPSTLLVDGMQQSRIGREMVERHLQSISCRELEIPEEWRRLASIRKTP